MRTIILALITILALTTRCSPLCPVWAEENADLAQELTNPSSI